MDLPKVGFGVPIEHWLRGPLREWAGLVALCEEPGCRFHWWPADIVYHWHLRELVR